MATLRETKDEEIKVFFCELKKGLTYGLFDDEPILIRCSFRIAVIVEAKITYLKKLMLSYYLGMHDRDFCWEFQNLELLDRLVNHLNKHKGRTLEEVLNRTFR